MFWKRFKQIVWLVWTLFQTWSLRRMEFSCPVFSRSCLRLSKTARSVTKKTLVLTVHQSLARMSYIQLGRLPGPILAARETAFLQRKRSSNVVLISGSTPDTKQRKLDHTFLKTNATENVRKLRRSNFQLKMLSCGEVKWWLYFLVFKNGMEWHDYYILHALKWLV